MEDDLDWKKTEHHLHEIIEMEPLPQEMTKTPEFPPPPQKKPLNPEKQQTKKTNLSSYYSIALKLMNDFFRT